MNFSRTIKNQMLIGAGIGIIIGVMLLLRHLVFMDFGFLSLGVYILEFPVRIVNFLGLPSNIYLFATSLIIIYAVIGGIIGYFANTIKKAFISLIIVLVVVSFGTWLFFEWATKKAVSAI
jgi:hypothetical protein